MNIFLKTLILLLPFFTLPFNSKPQSIKSNFCDKSVLSDKEYERCLSDSAWDKDIIIKINYLSFLKTEVFPPFRKERKKLVIQDSIQVLIANLKRTYDSVFLNRFQLYRKQMDRNQQYVQPKAYLSSVLSFELFNFYPDIFSVVMNDPIQTGKNSEHQTFITNFYSKTDYLYSLLNEKIRADILLITSKLHQQRNSRKEFQKIDIFQGELPEILKNKFDILNYLIWIE